jgi:ribonuclease P protein component
VDGGFDAVFRTGRRLEGAWLQLIVAPAAGPGRVGFVVGKRALPRAVDRNRLRRLLREAARKAHASAHHHDLILRLKTPCSRDELDLVAAEAAMLLAVGATNAPLRQ